MAQISIEWLINQLQLYYNGSMEFTYTEIIDLAKTFHSKEVKDAYNQGLRDGKKDWDIVLPKDVAEYSNAQNYYNQTFNK